MGGAGIDGGKSGLAVAYDASAAGYEAHWGPVLLHMSLAFLDELPVAEARAILDVGAGSGALLRHLLDRTDAVVVGVDRSFGMLGYGPVEAPRAVMDAERLAFKPGSFDLALAMFMLFHLPDPVAGLNEMKRILRPGGRVAFTTWGDDDPDFVAFEMFDEVLDRHGAAEGQGLHSCYELSDTPDKCASLLEKVGFEVVSVRAERMAHRWSIDDLIGFRTKVGYGRVRWESLDPPGRATALQEGREALAKLKPEQMVLRDEVIYCVGKVGGGRVPQSASPSP